MKIKGLNEALSRPGYTEDGKAATWNHRVVRRYSDAETWLEITEVHYLNGKPDCFAMEGRVTAAVDGNDDDTALADLRLTLDRMIKALELPILDERTNFPSVET